MPKLKFRAFRAIDDEEATQAYLRGYQNVLKSYGIFRVTSANVEWTESPDAYLIISENEENKIMAGARIQVASKGFLPIETAVGNLDRRVHDLVEKEKQDVGTAELCGLWNSREIAGYGVGSILLGRASVAVSNQIQVSSLLALCSPATLRNCMNVGFEKITSIGNSGTFYYPKENLLATALIIPDIITLNNAKAEEKSKILSLREDPEQIVMEEGPKGQMEVQYELIVGTGENNTQKRA